ncbi:MAG: aldehyde dehydrogenase family protein [Candidatus Kariarchaeaceae archaeon]|jgi:acyl-CoA reductase-like NAD-dependent aldehyde dehydrogenase
MTQYDMLVGGTWQPSSGNEYSDVINPATSEVIATVPKGNKDDVQHAINTARSAFDDPKWKLMDPSQRGRILKKLADLTYSNANSLALTESRNNGKPLRDAIGDVRYAAWTLEYYAGLTDKIEGKTIPTPHSTRLNYTLIQPVGVTAHIVPWNFPLQLAIRSIAPALAAGNAVIAKPASLTPLSLLEWAKLVEEAGIPSSIFQVLTGPGGEIGGTLTKSREIDSLTLTGSVETGKQVMKAAADAITPVTLELGGKGANIILPDANLKQAAKGVCFGIFWNAGQMCWAGSRLIVHESIEDKFIDAVKAEVDKWRIGPGTEEGVRIGSMVSQDQRESVLDYISQGINGGAKLISGGQPATGSSLDNGAFIEPTILSEVDSKSVTVQEEIFGPVLSVLRFNDDDEAVKLANDTDFGLLNGIWTNDLRKAHYMAREVESGMININEYPVTFPQTPFAGWKNSGIGSEQGIDALTFYTKTKNVSVNYA